MIQSRKNSQTIKYSQKKYIKTKTVRRNKNIFNIQQIDTFQTLEQRRHRTPYKSLTTSEMDQKFSQSFMNSTTINSFKLQNSISKHKQKVLLSHTPTRKNTRYVFFNHEDQKQQNSLNKKILGQQIKGVSMDKMITRQYRQSLDTRDNANEVRFNNYKLKQPQNDKIRAFQKYISRQQLQKLHVQKVPDSNPQIPIIYQKVTYPSNTFCVNWDYKKQKWDRGPLYYRVNKQSSLNFIEIQRQKLDKARENIGPRWNKTIVNFESISSKQQPSQFQRTFYPPNMKFRLKKPKLQVYEKSIKVKNIKKPEFQRWQLCNIKHFNLYHPKSTLQPKLNKANTKQNQNYQQQEQQVQQPQFFKQKQ